MLRATTLNSFSIEPTSAMLDVTQLLTDVLVSRMRDMYAETLPDEDPAGVEVVCDVARVALERIGDSNALYHNVEHTVHVTLVGLAILKGRKLLKGDVDRASWLNAVAAMLCHDIGFVRGLLSGDSSESVATGEPDAVTAVGTGASDARLMPLHIDRGRAFVRVEFDRWRELEPETIEANIERTRFPVPPEPQYAVCDDFPGLVRAADLVGQLSDKRYLHKLSAVFFELKENGVNEAQGYHEPGDLLRGYPNFFEHFVAPWIGPALSCLAQTPEGRAVVSQLYANLEQAKAAAELA